ARDLRALGSGALPVRLALVRRRERDRTRAAVGRRDVGLLPVQRRAVRSHAAHHGGEQLRHADLCRHARRARRRALRSPMFIAADPYPWPYDGELRPDNTALIVIDMQTDFCGKGGYVDKMGYDLSLTRAPIEPIRAVLAAMRKRGFHIIHTREGHRTDLSDLPDNKRWRS